MRKERERRDFKGKQGVKAERWGGGGGVSCVGGAELIFHQGNLVSVCVCLSVLGRVRRDEEGEKKKVG